MFFLWRLVLREGTAVRLVPVGSSFLETEALHEGMRDGSADPSRLIGRVGPADREVSRDG
jgi:hypothetical protein